MEVALRIHYLLVAWAGHLVSQSGKEKHLSLLEVQEMTVVAYQTGVQSFFSNENPIFPDAERPGGLVKESLLTMKGDGISGTSLWRKYGEMKSYIINHINPAWIKATTTVTSMGIANGNGGMVGDFPSGLTLEEVFQKVREDLWLLKEGQSLRKRIKREMQLFQNDWYPKEWMAFLYCGFPAGSNALPSFTGSLALSSAQLVPPRRSVQEFQASLLQRAPASRGSQHASSGMSNGMAMHMTMGLSAVAASLSHSPSSNNLSTGDNDNSNNMIISPSMLMGGSDSGGSSNNNNNMNSNNNGHMHHNSNESLLSNVGGPSQQQMLSMNTMNSSNNQQSSGLLSGMENRMGNHNTIISGGGLLQGHFSTGTHHLLHTGSNSDMHTMALLPSIPSHHHTTAMLLQQQNELLPVASAIHMSPMQPSLPQQQHQQQQPQQQYHRLSNSSMLLTSPPAMAPSNMDDIIQLRHMLQENNNLLRYDLELKRLEKLLNRAIATKKSNDVIHNLQLMLDLHLEQGVPSSSVNSVHGNGRSGGDNSRNTTTGLSDNARSTAGNSPQGSAGSLGTDGEGQGDDNHGIISNSER